MFPGCLSGQCFLPRCGSSTRNCRYRQRRAERLCTNHKPVHSHTPTNIATPIKRSRSAPDTPRAPILQSAQVTTLLMIQLGLQRAAQLFRNNPQPWKAVHVAGTNGKGTVCAYLSALLNAGGVQTGRFTSPHLIDR